MFTFFDLSTKKCNNSNDFNFMYSYKSKWNEIYDKSNVFRYKIMALQERILNDKYMLQCNPERGYNRRVPQEINNIYQPFDDKKFNFNKVSSEEIMFTFSDNQGDDYHTVLVNVSPISRYHALLCPSINKCLPQVVTKNSLKLAIDIMLVTSDRDLRIAFNSLCAFASVNHLHYHLCLMKENLPVETLKCKQIRGALYCLDDSYPAPAFCFEVISPFNPYEDIFKVLEYFLKNSIAHNIFMTRGSAFDGEKEAIRVIIWPRKSSSGVKQFNHFNVAALELSGWITVFDESVFENLEEKDIESELIKWKYEPFDKLSDDIKLLY